MTGPSTTPNSPSSRQRDHTLKDNQHVYFALSQGWHELLTLESIRENIGKVDEQIEANFLLVFVAFMLVYAACTAFMVPASFLTIAGGAIFGLTFGIPLFGALATVVGATLGASALFLAAKTSIGETLRGIAGPFMAKMEKEYNEAPILYLIILRLVPAVPFAVANIAPSLLGAKYRNYLPTTFFGIMPGTLAYSWIGASAAVPLSVILPQKCCLPLSRFLSCP